MIMDRSIVTRFDPAGFQLPAQFLCRDAALFSEHEWSWGSDRELAWVFDTNADARQEAGRHVDRNAAGDPQTPWAIVLGNPQATAERERRHADQDARLEAQVSCVSPQEAYRALEKRHLA